jgi:putative ABC transport system permease protein
MNSLRRGLRSGFSLFRTNPGAAVAAVVALALGIGFSTTMFSIVHGATKGLPFEDAAEIVAVQRLATGPGAVPTSTVRDFKLWAHNVRSFEALGAFQSDSHNLSGEGEAPERVSMAALTPGSLELLRVAPSAGRSLLARDAVVGAEPVALLSHDLWHRRFGGDPAVIGRVIRLDGVVHTVIGIMPAGFGFPINAKLWTALRSGDPASDAEAVQVFGRLADDVGFEAAKTELLTVARAAAETESARSAIALDVVNFIEIETPREAVWGLYLLLVAVTGVLLIACVNVANLFIVRAIARSRDVAVRLALGAARRTILVEQMAESLVLSTMAAAGGLAIAWAGTRAFRLGSANILEAFWLDFRLDASVVTYASVLAIAAAAAAAIVPALRSSRTDIVSTLRDGGLSSSSLKIGRLSRGLLAGQIAVACALLAFTLLLGQASVAMHTRPWPFDPDKVLGAQIGIPFATLDDNDARERMLVRLEEELRHLPGARSAALASVLPGRGAGNWSFSLDSAETEPSRMRTAGLTMVSSTYFDTLGARLLRGRGITRDDTPAAPPVVVVNESFVARHSSDRDPIGRRVFLGRRELTIVGVVPDLMSGDVDEVEQHGMYASIHQLRPYNVRVIAAGPADPMTLLRPLRAVVDHIDADLPLYEAFTVRESALREKQVLSVLSRLFGIFGTGALLLTAIGLYSVTAFAVALRRRELGIRVALGATRADLLRQLSAQSGRQLAIGLTVGTLLALGLTRAFSASVELKGASDSFVLGSVVLSLFVTSLMAVAVPFLRASRTDPVKALRT